MNLDNDELDLNAEPFDIDQMAKQMDFIAQDAVDQQCPFKNGMVIEGQIFNKWYRFEVISVKPLYKMANIEDTIKFAKKPEWKVVAVKVGIDKSKATLKDILSFTGVETEWPNNIKKIR
jgi:hypothetical protein